MNNKGQVLVIFVILLPILLLILTLIIDLGLLSIEKRKVDNNTYDAVKYYLDNIDDEDVYEKTIDLLNYNLSNVDISIIDNDYYVEIEVKENYKSLYSTINKSFIDIKYKGMKINKNIIKG